MPGNKQQFQKRRVLLLSICILLFVTSAVIIAANAVSIGDKYRQTQAAKATPAPPPMPSLTPLPSPTPVPTPALAANVENSYFEDAVFIGDSRTEGFMLYSGMSEGTYYYHTGLMVDTIFTTPVVKTANGKISIIQALQQQQFGKVYIMLGVNELGWPYDDVFIEKYGEVVDAVKKAQPNAVIYVQSILPVSHQKEQSNPIYNNTKIQRFNRLIENMCQEKGVHFLAVYEAVQAPDGSLPDEASADGVHLNREYCAKWLDYLKQHTVQ